MWSAIYTALTVIVVGAGVICAWRAAVTARTPQGAVGWVVFLLTAPYVAVFAYLFLGQHRYERKLRRRQMTDRLISPHRPGTEDAPAAGPGGINTRPFERVAQMPVTGGNRMQLLIDGEATFEAMFAAIDGAERYVLAQFYIIHDDEIGRQFAGRLIAAAARGATVYLLYDAVGCQALPNAYLERLREAGVRVMDRYSNKTPTFRFQINFRNHRKTVVVDGHTAFTGGLNVGDEYLGRDPVYGAWRDTHVMVSGPLVSQLQLNYCEDWHWAMGDMLHDDLNWAPPVHANGMAALVIGTGPADEMETGALMFFSAIAEARERIWIATPYCVPDTDILSALKHAGLRGLDVRLLLPDTIDHYLPWLAGFAYYDELMRAGVQIWRYTEGFMHQKAILVDDRMLAVGTTNLDNRSFRLNFETMALFFDGEAARAGARMLEADFKRAYRLGRTLSEQPWRVRNGAPVARLFAPLL